MALLPPPDPRAPYRSSPYSTKNGSDQPNQPPIGYVLGKDGLRHHGQSYRRCELGHFRLPGPDRATYRDSLNAQYDDLDEANRGVYTHEEGQWIVSANYIYGLRNGGSLNFAVQNLFATEPPDRQGGRFYRRLREFGLQYRQSFEN